MFIMNKETVRTEGSVIVLHFSKSFIYNEPPLKQHDRLCKKITFKHEGQSEGLQLHHIQESQTPQNNVNAAVWQLTVYLH